MKNLLFILLLLITNAMLSAEKNLFVVDIDDETVTIGGEDGKIVTYKGLSFKMEPGKSYDKNKTEKIKNHTRTTSFRGLKATLIKISDKKLEEVKNNDGHLEIPAGFKYRSETRFDGNGNEFVDEYKVLEIIIDKESPLKNLKEIKTLTLSKTTKQLKDHALDGCENLKTIKVISPKEYTTFSTKHDSLTDCELKIPEKEDFGKKIAQVIRKDTNVTISNVLKIAENNMEYNLLTSKDVVLSSIKDNTTKKENIKQISHNKLQESVEDISYGDLIIPNFVKYIGESFTVVGIDDSTFKDSKKLRSVVIPDSVRLIGAQTFDGCSNLTSIILLNSNPPTVQTTTFYNMDKSKCVLKVRKEALDEFKSAEGWREFKSIAGFEMGDVNGDEILDKDDESDMIRFIIGEKNSNFRRYAADINGDDEVNVLDFTTIKDKLLDK